MPSRFIHSLTNGKIFFFIWLIWSNIPLFHYLYIPHFLIPFIHWQIVRGFHMLATVNNTILNMVVQAPLGDSDSASSSSGILDHTKGEGDDRGWDGWMASLTRWTWVWLNSGSWWWTGRPGVLQFMGLQKVGHDWTTELNWRSVLYGSSVYSCYLLISSASVRSILFLSFIVPIFSWNIPLVSLIF